MLYVVYSSSVCVVCVCVCACVQGKLDVTRRLPIPTQANPSVVTLCRDCAHMKSAMRPHFGEVERRLRSLRTGVWILSYVYVECVYTFVHIGGAAIQEPQDWSHHTHKLRDEYECIVQVSQINFFLSFVAGLDDASNAFASARSFESVTQNPGAHFMQMKVKASVCRGIGVC